MSRPLEPERSKWLPVDQVVIREDFARFGHLVAILGHQYPGGPRQILRPTGEWVPLPENAAYPDDAGELWWRLPEGALDALVSAHTSSAAPQPATERHLTDAIEVRDRLLKLVEKR